MILQHDPLSSSCLFLLPAPPPHHHHHHHHFPIKIVINRGPIHHDLEDPKSSKRSNSRLAGCLKAPLSTTLVAQPMRWAVYLDLVLGPGACCPMGFCSKNRWCLGGAIVPKSPYFRVNEYTRIQACIQCKCFWCGKQWFWRRRSLDIGFRVNEYTRIQACIQCKCFWCGKQWFWRCRSLDIGLNIFELMRGDRLIQSMEWMVWNLMDDRNPEVLTYTKIMSNLNPMKPKDCWPIFGTHMRDSSFFKLLKLMFLGFWMPWLRREPGGPWLLEVPEAVPQDPAVLVQVCQRGRPHLRISS